VIKGVISISEFTNEQLIKMDKNKEYNAKYYKYYKRLHKEINSPEGKFIKSEFMNTTYTKKAERINSCLNLWAWDKYEKNKLLDLKTVNRCKNNRFCPNCRAIDISKFIFKFKDVLDDYVKKGYGLYMLTLTISSVPGEALQDTIKKLSKKFLAFQVKFGSSQQSYKNKIICIDGGVRILEITYSELMGYHPHLHCVVLVKDIDIIPEYLKKDIKGRYSKKRKSFNKKSIYDCEFGKFWSMLWQDLNCSKSNLAKYDYIPTNNFIDKDQRYKLLEVDFRKMDRKGFYEVFKYTFKNTDIKNYEVFKTLEIALTDKRVRQGFGNLYNLKCEDVEIGEYQELDLEEEESPELLLTRAISELYEKYSTYRKISRFDCRIDNNIK